MITVLSMIAVYFDQLSGAACTQKLVETLFSVVHFQMFFVDFKREITEKILK